MIYTNCYFSSSTNILEQHCQKAMLLGLPDRLKTTYKYNFGHKKSVVSLDECIK